MIVIDNLMQVANQIETERGVNKAVLFSAVEQALVAACKKKLSEEANVRCELNPETGEAKLFVTKTVVKEVLDENLEISLAEAKKYNSSVKVDEELEMAYNSPDFGRTAAQTAKQVIVQRLREAEKDSVFNEFQHKIGQIITGTVQRIENKNYLINLGRTEAVLTPKDQIQGEYFQVKEKVKLYVVDILKEARGNYIHVSRTHPGLLEQLFKIEIPEIQDGIIEIKSVARDPGKRAKIAVKSNSPTIGAVGTCVGQMGNRIQTIIKELGNEKIDVLEWDSSPKAFIANALKPAKISQVIIDNEAERIATVVVPNDQLSLAIGKQGVNVRLSVKLTGWKLDILSEDEYGKRTGSEKGLSIVEKIKLSKAQEKAEEAALAEMEAEKSEEAVVSEETEA